MQQTLLQTKSMGQLTLTHTYFNSKIYYIANFQTYLEQTKKQPNIS